MTLCEWTSVPGLSERTPGDTDPATQSHNPEDLNPHNDALYTHR